MRQCDGLHQRECCPSHALRDMCASAFARPGAHWDMHTATHGYSEQCATARAPPASGILYTWYMSVRTGTYRHVPTCTMLSYVPVRTIWKMSHDGTGRYIPVRTSTGKCPKVRTRTYLTAYKAVQGSTERYRAVHEMVQGSTGQSPTRYKAVHGGTCQYTVCIYAGPRVGGAGERAILVRF